MRQKRRRSSKRQGKLNLDSIDIREVLDDLHIHYTESGKNVSDGWIGVACPFCDDSSNHMGINLAHKTISCFKCGEPGTVIKYLSEELRSFNKAIQILGDAVPRELRSFETEKTGGVSRVELPKEASRKITPYHAGFLEDRGYDWKDISDRYNMHFCGPIGIWRNRIIVPVIKSYKLITFTSVDISDETDMRYRHLKDEESIIPIKHHLFGLEFTDNHTAIVVEGFFDQLRFGDGAVATFGTTVTPEQKRLLSKFSVVKICFDGDEAGRKGGQKLANDLAPFCEVKIFDLPEGTDPDKLPPEDIKSIKES